MNPWLAWWLGGSMGPAGHLEWTAPQWAVIVASAVGLLCWALVLRGPRGWAARTVEALGWGLALLALCVAVARPVWVEEEGRVEPGRIAVLVDGSRSMAVIEEGRPRSVAADELVRRLSGPNTDVFAFGSDLRPGSPSKYDLPATDVEGALSQLSERAGGDRLSGIVLVSDGIDRGLLRRRYREDVQAELPPLNGPLTVYQVGTAAELRDLSVVSIDTGGFAFIHSAFTLRAHVVGVGFEGRTVTAQLARDGAPAGTSAVTLGPDGRGDAVFEVIPDKAGRFTYSVSVPVLEGDAVPANNLAPVVVRVVRDRIRVLQVAGGPSWDVKALRRFLKGDPSVDLVSFFILRTDDDMDSGYADDELSLIPFPYDRLFTTEIDTFDLVIFQDFDYAPYFKRNHQQLLGSVRRFVEEDGKGFVMIGGSRSFDLGQYAGTPIADLLPLQIGLQPDRNERVCAGLCDAAAFAPQLTEAGKRHPITRLFPDSEENERAWAQLRPSDGVNLSLGATSNAATLLEHPSRVVNGSPLPVLAVREAKKGRSMALAIDSSWRWSLSEAAAGRGNQAYLRFWKNAFRWLVADPTMNRVTVETARENYGLGDVVRIVVGAKDPAFAPLAGAKVNATLRVGDGDVKLSGETGPDGDAVIEWPAATRGAVRVDVKVQAADGAEVGAASTVLAVTSRDPELEEVVPDAAFLRWLAGRAGGQYVAPGGGDAPLTDATSGRQVWDRRETPLWRAPALVLVAVLAAGVAWLVRRRAGLR
jgi:uncharacterized membrane protein